MPVVVNGLTTTLAYGGDANGYRCRWMGESPPTCMTIALVAVNSIAAPLQSLSGNQAPVMQQENAVTQQLYLQRKALPAAVVDDRDYH